MTHEDFYPLILPDVPGCPLPTLDMAINRAAREFCTRALVWREQAWPVALRAGEWRYDIDPDLDAGVVVLNSVRLDGRLLDPFTDPRAIVPWGSRSGAPGRYAVSADAEQIYLDPTPSEAGQLILNVVLRPLLRATSLPDVLERYSEGLAEGVKFRLLRLPNQSWTDSNGSMVALQLFEKAMSEARIETETGHVVGSLRVTPRAFGRSR